MWDAIMLWIAKDIAPWVEFLVIGVALFLYCFVHALIGTLADKMHRKRRTDNDE